MASVDRVDKTQVPSSLPLSRARGAAVSPATGRVIGRVFTYALLLLGAIIMFFPLFWMFTASFKPQWQIFTQPPIWIPSEWIEVQAGNTPEGLPTWYATSIGSANGQPQLVIKIGTRRYTNAVDVSALQKVVSVPASQLSSAQPTAVGNLILNVRTWTPGSGSPQQVIAVGRDGDNLIIAPVDGLGNAIQQIPLDVLNTAKRTDAKVGSFTLQAREVGTEGKAVLGLGPETQLTVVAPKEVAATAILVEASALTQADHAPIGKTDIPTYTLANHSPDERFILLISESWQPILSLDEAMHVGLTAPNSQLSTEAETQQFQSAAMPLRTLTQDDGKQIKVVELIRNSERSFVIPVDKATTLRLTPLGKLAQPFIMNIAGSSVQYREDYEENGKRYAVAIVGQRRDMALVTPKSAVTDAFDVPNQDIKPVLVPRLSLQNYIDSLSKDLGGATFVTFFRNSALLVLLNLIGHFLSVTVVAYGFARLRAPGQNFLFLLLLSTMMLPFPVLLIPTYEIFRGLGMIDTLWPLFLRSFFGNAFLIFLLRQFFMAIPRELEEAARIDGANTAQVLLNVMLPLSKPALATIGIFTFWWTWNSFFEPFVYLTSVKNYTVSLGLAFFKGQYTTSYHLLMAASMVATLPIILIFFFAQRYFIEGIQLQGLKG
jgi:multiple sugar transport system permease protein